MAAVVVMVVVMATVAASTSVDRVAGGTTTAFASAGIIDTELISVSTHDRQQELGVSGNRRALFIWR